MVEVTQRDRDAAADFYDRHLARPGEVPVAAAMRMRHIDDSPLVQAFAQHRTDAIAREGEAPITAQARVEAMRSALEDVAPALVHILEQEQIQDGECAAWSEQPLCGAQPCQETGCIVDKLARLRNALSAPDHG